MIIDVHGHYTTAPPELRAWRQEQMPPSARRSTRSSASRDDQIVETLEADQLKLQRERGTDLTLFSPTAGGMEHHVGDPETSLQWTRTVNDLIHRVCDLVAGQLRSRVPAAAVARLSPEGCIEELERCVNSWASSAATSTRTPLTATGPTRR